MEQCPLFRYFNVQKLLWDKVFLPPERDERKKWKDTLENQVKELQIHSRNHTWHLSGTWDEVQAAREILESLYSERKHVIHMKLEEHYQLSDPKKSNVPDRFSIHSDNTPLKVSAIHQKETINLPQITGSQDSDKLVIPKSGINKVPTEFTSSEKSLPFPIGQYPSSKLPLFKMPNTTTIYLYKYNITKLAVDVIVNAANGRTTPPGGCGSSNFKSSRALISKSLGTVHCQIWKNSCVWYSSHCSWSPAAILTYNKRSRTGVVWVWW